MSLAYFMSLFALSVAAAASYFPEACANAVVAGIIPNAHTCMIPSSQPGMPPIQALQRIGPSAFAAQANWGVGEVPTITYSSIYFRLEPTIQLFLSLHECGHLVLRTSDEFQANCYAIMHGAWTEADLKLIEMHHEAVGSLPSQYGGSGHTFWAGTKRACPQAFYERRT